MKRFIVGVGAFSLFILPNFYGGFAGTAQTVQGGGCIGRSGTEGQEAPQDSGDADGDAVLDANDNCPDVFNPHQTDLHPQDGVGDLCQDFTPTTCDAALVCDSDSDCRSREGLIEDLCRADFVAEDQALICCDARCVPSASPECPAGTCPTGDSGGHCSDSTDCQEEFSKCSDGCCIRPGSGSPTCGNGQLDPLAEDCDIVPREGGGTGPIGCLEGDVCNTDTCTCEDGGGPGGPVCGDGIWSSGTGEECDLVTPPSPRGEPVPDPVPIGCGEGETCNPESCLCIGCGNLRVDEGEACDYVMTRSGLQPSGSCDFVGGATCDAETCECTGGEVPPCGDPLVCEEGEQCADCAECCQSGGECGDASCDAGEDCANCPADCGCGAGFCFTELPVAFCIDESCPSLGGGPGVSCQSDAICGSLTELEAPTTGICLEGCCEPLPSVCPDGTCNGSESCDTCPMDCGECGPPPSGCFDGFPDGICDGLVGEDCLLCPEDCGPCEGPVCGNALCEPGEDSLSCPGDCPPRR